MYKRRRISSAVGQSSRKNYARDSPKIFKRFDNSQWRSVYSNGQREDFESRELFDIYKEYKYRLIASGQLQKPTIDETLSRELNALHDAEQFVEPKHFTCWLEESLNDTQRGLLFLEAERGLGKSVFCRALYPIRGEKSIEFPDVAVRCFYANRSQFFHKLPDFLNSLKSCMNTNNRGENQHFTEFDIPSLVATPRQEGADLLAFRKKEMAEFLNRYREIYEKLGYGNKIILVIDGLDELLVRSETSDVEPHLASNRIFNYIPDTEMLDEGVYILVTSRPVTELKVESAVHDELSALWNRADIKREFLSTDEGNINLLKTYLQIKNVKPKKHAEFFEQANHRILHLRLLALLDRERFDQMQGVINVEKLIEYFFEKLSLELPKILAEQCHRMLLSIANAPEPITFEELLYLIDEPFLSYRFLYLLNKINVFLVYERDPHRNSSLISIANKAWADVFRRDEESLALRREWVDKACRIDPKLDDLTDAELLVLASLYDNSDEFNNFCDGYSANDVVKWMIPWVTKDFLQNERSYIYRRKRVEKTMQNLFMLCEEIRQANPDVAHFQQYSAHILDRWGEYLIDGLDEPERALDILTRAREGYELLREKISDSEAGRVCVRDSLTFFEFCELELRKVYFSLHKVYRRLGRESEAASVWEKAWEFFCKKNHVAYYASLPPEYKSLVHDIHDALCKKLQDSGKHLEAIQGFSKSVQLREKLSHECSLLGCKPSLLEESKIGDVYASRGYSNAELNFLDKALEDCNKAIDIQQRFKDKDHDFIRHNLASALWARAHSLRASGKEIEALDDANSAIEIIEKLQAKGKNIDPLKLAEFYKGRGMMWTIAYQDDTKSAVDFSKSIKIYERLHSEGKLDVLELLEETLAYRDEALFMEYVTDTPISQIDQDYFYKKLAQRSGVIDMIDQEIEKGAVDEVTARRSQANNSITQADERRIAGQYEEALKITTESIERLEEIANLGDSERDCRGDIYLAMAYFKRACIYYHDKKHYARARPDLEKATDIMTTLYRQGKLSRNVVALYRQALEMLSDCYRREKKRKKAQGVNEIIENLRFKFDSNNKGEIS